MLVLNTGMGILERKPLEECKEELKAKFWPTYKVWYCVTAVVNSLSLLPCAV